jgi:hypothetical protein
MAGGEAPVSVHDDREMPRDRRGTHSLEKPAFLGIPQRGGYDGRDGPARRLRSRRGLGHAVSRNPDGLTVPVGTVAETGSALVGSFGGPFARPTFEPESQARQT